MSFSDAATLSAGCRERPSLIFAADGHTPIALVNGFAPNPTKVGAAPSGSCRYAGVDYAYTLVQPLKQADSWTIHQDHGRERRAHFTPPNHALKKSAVTAAKAATWAHLAKYDSTYDCSGKNNTKMEGCAPMLRQKSLLDCQAYCAKTKTPAGTNCTVFAFQESGHPDKNGTKGCWFRWGSRFEWKDPRDCPPPLRKGCNPSGDSSGCLVGKVKGCK